MAASDRIINAGVRLLKDVLTRALRNQPDRKPSRRDRTSRPEPSRRGRPSRPEPSHTTQGDSYPGDYRARPQITYAPFPDKAADPGEIVWTWVPYEEDHSKGKDRPVLVIGRDDVWLLALQVTSKDHDRDSGQEAAEGRFWEDIGSGAWDSQGRPSEVRVNRIIRVDPNAIRRIGATLDRERFELVAAAVLTHY